MSDTESMKRIPFDGVALLLDTLNHYGARVESVETIYRIGQVEVRQKINLHMARNEADAVE